MDHREALGQGGLSMVNLLDLVVRMQQLNVTLDQAGRVSISGKNKHVEQHTPIAKVVARKVPHPSCFSKSAISAWSTSFLTSRAAVRPEGF
jgi:hypothetical protein